MSFGKLVPASPEDLFSAIAEGENGSIWVAQETPGAKNVFIEVAEDNEEFSAAVHFTPAQLKRLVFILSLALVALEDPID